MSDLIKRLRDGVKWSEGVPLAQSASLAMSLAADRIEALEAALRQARQALVVDGGAYDALKILEADKALPGYARCKAESDAAIAAINDLLKD